MFDWLFGNEDVDNMVRERVQSELFRAKQLERPCILHGATIRRYLKQYVAELGDVKATGATPEIAMAEFDHLWRNG